MDLKAPFTGTLYLPDKGFLNPVSAVLLSDGSEIAAVQWHSWSQRFEILDSQQHILAGCRAEGFFSVRYPVVGAKGQTLLTLKPGAWRGLNGDIITLANGRTITMDKLKIMSDRQYEFSGSEGLIGRILPTTGAFSFRPDSYAFELFQPAMSALQAIGLAQAIRLAVRRRRQSSSATGVTS